MRPIDADALKEILGKYHTLTKRCRGSIPTDMAVESCVVFLDEAPTLDVEPVRRGEWEEVSFNMLYEKNGFEHRLGSARCSECSRWSYLFNDYTHDFDLTNCPNCGAKMGV